MHAGLGSDAALYLEHVAREVNFDLTLVTDEDAKKKMLSQAERCCDEHRMPDRGNEVAEQATLLSMFTPWRRQSRS